MSEKKQAGVVSNTSKQLGAPLNNKVQQKLAQLKGLSNYNKPGTYAPSRLTEVAENISAEW